VLGNPAGPKMTMRIIAGILSLAALIWVEAATAQKTFSLSVSHHTAVPPLSEEEVKRILADASKMLQKVSHSDCNVTFTLSGPIRTFPRPDMPAPDEPIVKRNNIAAFHRVDSDVTGTDFHVKVVKEIRFCRPDLPNPNGLFEGCSFLRPVSRSIIVVHPKFHKNPHDLDGPPLSDYPDHVLWAHEFGHLTGLPHRRARLALMTPCSLTEFTDPNTRVRVNRAECRRFRSGPGAPPPRPIGCQ
jgi:hypothetical protein